MRTALLVGLLLLTAMGCAADPSTGPADVPADGQAVYPTVDLSAITDCSHP